jgi:MoxR-like ATPase
MRRMAAPERMPAAKPVVKPEQILAARAVLGDLYVDERVEGYIVDLVLATRDPQRYRLRDAEGLIEYGASPRASIYLNRAARAHAFLQHRAYVTPEDVRAIALDVLRHRVSVTYEAEAEEVTSEMLVRQILDTVEVP